MPTDPQTTAIPAWRAAYDYLLQRGHRVEPQDIPGLWRIDGGPEITSGQLVAIAQKDLRHV